MVAMNAGICAERLARLGSTKAEIWERFHNLTSLRKGKEHVACQSL
jgi:hypothetical protein